MSERTYSQAEVDEIIQRHEEALVDAINGFAEHHREWEKKLDELGKKFHWKGQWMNWLGWACFWVSGFWARGAWDALP
jgi:hypothetical protein